MMMVVLTQWFVNPKIQFRARNHINSLNYNYGKTNGHTCKSEVYKSHIPRMNHVNLTHLPIKQNYKTNTSYYQKNCAQTSSNNPIHPQKSNISYNANQNNNFNVINPIPSYGDCVGPRIITLK